MIVMMMGGRIGSRIYEGKMMKMKKYECNLSDLAQADVVVVIHFKLLLCWFCCSFYGDDTDSV